MSFLDQLPLSASEKAKLLSFGASSPRDLLGLIQAAHDDFARYFGTRRTQQLVSWLAARLDNEDRQVLSQPVHHYPIQAPVFSQSPAPALPPTKFDIAERDRLFERLQKLRAESHPSDRTREEIADYEARLNAMLE